MNKIKSKFASKAKGLEGEDDEGVSPQSGRKRKDRDEDEDVNNQANAKGDDDEDEGCGDYGEYEDKHSKGESDDDSDEEFDEGRGRRKATGNDEKEGERGGRGRARGKVREESEGEADGDEIAPVGEDQFKTDVAPTRANQSLIILEEKLDDFVTNILKAWQSSHRRSSDAHLRQTTTKMFVDGCRQVYVSGQFTTKVTFAQKLTRALSTLLAAFVKEQGIDDAQSKGIQRWVSALEGELLSLWTYIFEF